MWMNLKKGDGKLFVEDCIAFEPMRWDVEPEVSKLEVSLKVAGPPNLQIKP